MKKRRKHKRCLNCGQNLHESHNYCSNCGQENTDNEVSIGLLLREFTSNFLSLDSRFGRTLKPFVFRPGKITNSFNQGMRVFYANPIRWYLVISIFHFFFFMRVVDPSETKGRNFVFNSGLEALSEVEFDSLFYLPDSLRGKDDWPISNHYFILVDEMNKSDELSSSEIMDSLKLNNLPFIERLATKQIIRINHESSANVFQYILKQIPIIIFFILPVYAFILKLFFWRKGLYIKHLIHSLHIHAFIFFMLSIGWISVLIFGDAANKTLVPINMLLSAVYVLISFRNIYGVRWVWTILRFFMVGFLYSIVLSISMGVGMLISLILF